MTKLLVKDWRFRLALLLAIWSMFPGNGMSQPECRSVLGAHLKPVSESIPLNWASELTLSPGAMSDRFIFNGMAYLGMEYISKSMEHQLYFEGAYKYWYNTADGPGLDGTGTGYSDFNKPEKKHFGIRELYYSYSDWMDIKAGIQTMKSSESMLLDERVLGISSKKKLNGVSLSLSGGTVFDDIARMQDVCGTRHLYNLVRGSKVNFVGDKMFDSNFVLAEINWAPGKKETMEGEEGDEFGAFESSNEFSDFSSSEEKKKTKYIQFKNIGFKFYDEFGVVFPVNKFYTGVSSNINILESFQLDAELIGQFMNENNSAFWRVGISKEKFRNNGSLSTFKAEYLGVFNVEEEIQHFPAYSNLFKGEVMRLDMMHLPVVELEVSHRFANKMKSALKCNYIHQLKDEQNRELDLVYSIQPWKHLHLFAIGAYMQSDLMEDDNFLLKLEARFAF